MLIIKLTTITAIVKVKLKTTVIVKVIIAILTMKMTLRYSLLLVGGSILL